MDECDNFKLKVYLWLILCKRSHLNDNDPHCLIPVCISPSWFEVVVGQLSPNITTEVDWESLFNQAVHLSKLNREQKHDVIRDQSCLKDWLFQSILWHVCTAAPEKILKLNSWKGVGTKEKTEQQKVEYLEEDVTRLGIFAKVVDGEENSM